MPCWQSEETVVRQLEGEGFGGSSTVYFLREKSQRHTTDSLARRKSLGRHRHGSARAKRCWNPPSKGHALCSERQSHPHCEIKRMLVTEPLPFLAYGVAIRPENKNILGRRTQQLRFLSKARHSYSKNQNNLLFVTAGRRRNMIPASRLCNVLFFSCAFCPVLSYLASERRVSASPSCFLFPSFSLSLSLSPIFLFTIFLSPSSFFLFLSLF